MKHTERRTETTKTVRETEAEAVAFVVAQGIGINAAQSASYIQLYHGNAALLMESLEAVQQTAAKILLGTEEQTNRFRRKSRKRQRSQRTNTSGRDVPTIRQPPK